MPWSPWYGRGESHGCAPSRPPLTLCAYKTLPVPEKGGHVQQCILDVLPQPVGVLEGEMCHVQEKLGEELPGAEKQEVWGPRSWV